jgi:hypothetical protein
MDWRIIIRERRKREKARKGPREEHGRGTERDGRPG